MGLSFSKGHLSQAVMIRIERGADIIEGIETVCRRLDIHSGVIPCCIGSLQRVAYLIAVPRKNKLGSGYSDPKVLEGPLELLSGQGMIGKEESGEYFIHLHGLISDRKGVIHGGHFIKGKSPVLITCEIMISQVQDVKMIRTYDPKIDMKVLMPFSDLQEAITENRGGGHG